MTITANSFDVIAGEIREPLRGPWTAKLEIDIDSGQLETPIAVGAPITIVFDDGLAPVVTYVGTVKRGAEDEGRWTGTVVGGAGKLRTELPAKYYNAGTASLVITDVLTVGEVLDVVNTDPTVLAYALAKWGRQKGEARLALTRLVKEFNGVWRVGRNGLVLFKQVDLFPPAIGEFDEVDRNTNLGEIIIAVDSPVAEPATTVGTDKIAEVITKWDDDDPGIRQILTVEDPDAKPRGAGAQWAAKIRQAVESDINYSQLYPCTVVKQNPVTLGLELMPDDDRVSGGGLSEIQIRHGLPGVKVKASPGARVNLFFENGDPKKPAAALWPDGSACLEITINPSVFLNLSGDPPTDFVTLANALTNSLTAIITAAPVLATDGGAAFKGGLLSGIGLAWPAAIQSLKTRSS